MEKLKIIFYILFSLVTAYEEEGNILIPMTSQLTLEYSKKTKTNKNYYTIDVEVGNPKKIFNLQIDTSITTSWIPSVKCINCECDKNKLYDPKKSLTSNSKESFLELEDEDGNVKGYETSDDFYLGEYKINQLNFIQVTEVNEKFRDHYGGKLGLGYRGEYSNEYNLLEKLKKQNLISKKIFTINEINDKKGLLFIGDYPAKEYPFCNVTSGEDLDELYKESWVCELTHVGFYSKDYEGKNLLKNYSIISDGKVNFDSAYDFIAVPIMDRKIIEKLLEEADLNCRTDEIQDPNLINNNKTDNNKNFNDLFKSQEISIFCKTSEKELENKNLALSFILQGNIYNIPFKNLFTKSENSEFEMLIKYINNKEAIWTLGYPFMNQYLVIFNLEDNHVGFKKQKKTELPIINIDKEWNEWYAIHQKNSYKNYSITIIVLITTVLVIILTLLVVYLIIKAVKRNKKEEELRKSNESKNIGSNNNSSPVYEFH